jgi:hypothetical protein
MPQSEYSVQILGNNYSYIKATVYEIPQSETSKIDNYKMNTSSYENMKDLELTHIQHHPITN